jgi:hypothetical protein
MKKVLTILLCAVMALPVVYFTATDVEARPKIFKRAKSGKIFRKKNYRSNWWKRNWLKRSSSNSRYSNSRYSNSRSSRSSASRSNSSYRSSRGNTVINE